MSTPASVATALGEIFAPLLIAFEDSDALYGFFDDLGWTPEGLLGDTAAYQAILPVAPLIEELNDFVAAANAGEQEAGDLVGDAVVLSESVFEAISGLAMLGQRDVSSLVAPLDDPATWSEIAADLPEYLLTSWLAEYHPLLHAVLLLGGGIAEVSRGDNKPPRYEIDLDACAALLTDPPGQLAKLYDWGGTFRHELLSRRLGRLARAAGIVTEHRTVRTPIVDAYFQRADAETARELRIGLHAGWTPGYAAFFDLGLLLVPIPTQEVPERPDGLLLTHELSGAGTGKILVGNGWEIELRAVADTSGLVGLALTPSGARATVGDVAPDTMIALVTSPSEPWVLVGAAEGTRLELGGLRIELALGGTVSSPEVSASLNAPDLQLVINPGDGDSFLAGALGDPLHIPMAVEAGWSSEAGWRFGGGPGFEAKIAIGKQIGPIRVDWIRLAGFVGSDGLTTEVAATGGIVLGPFAASVEDIGLRALATPLEDGRTDGLLGPLDLEIGFKPPKGLGLALDIPGVASGGGYLYFDKDDSEYAGVADLDLLGVGVTATGLIATRLPDGSDGWSMFLSLTARFVGVQLGFGFTLNGVGGLVGIHRGLDADALGEVVCTGSLDGILFPEDPVADAMRILADIDAVFPPVRDQYVFGPVVKIGWGTPTLIEIDVGVAIQLPEPLTISLLGALSTVLPDKAVPVLELRATFAGTANVTDGTVKVDAALSGSKVAGLVITGDMAVRTEFLGKPSFLVAFGGSHPGFDPPACFPALERLGIAVDTGETLQLALGGYFALSSNSIQFGASAELFISEAGFTAEGSTSFDALIIYRPFGFDVRLSLWVSVSASGAELMCVLLEGELTGPNPWQAAGSASFKVLGVKVPINVDVTFGDRERQSAIAKSDVLSLLIEALEQADAWRILTPTGAMPVMTTEDTDVQRLDPAGRIQVTQRITPLDQKIERYGHEALADADIFSVTAVDLAEEETEAVEDWFGTEHYFDLDPSERLSAPSFTECKSGIIIGSSLAQAPPARSLTYDHEIVYKDSAAQTPKRAVGLRDAGQYERALAGRQGSQKGRSFSIKPAAYKIADAATGAIDSAVGDSGGSYFDARQTLIASGAAMSVIVPSYELELRL